MAIVSDAAQSPGDVIRRLDELEKALQEANAARRLESAVIGSGGIKVRGGEIRIQTPDGLTDLAVLASDGIFFNGQPLLFPGSLGSFAGPVEQVPIGWLVCDGASLLRATYPALFAVIGTTWGSVDGTHFNVPDLRDRVLIGAGSTYALGATGGATSHTHTNPTTSGGSAHGHTIGNTGSESGHTHTQAASTGSATASHTHTIPQGTDVTSGVGGTAVFTVSHSQHTHGGTNSSSSTSHSHDLNTTNAGSSHAHTTPNTADESSHTHTQADTGSGTNLPPYAAVIPIIRY